MSAVTLPPAPETHPGVTAAALQTMRFAPVRWTVEGYVAEGLTVMAGKPKLGKSWLALDIALGVAQGGVAMGKRPCAKGAVLYAALEDTLRRLQDRVRKVHGPCSESWPESLTFWTAGQMERLDRGGLKQLRAWIAANPDASLIIVDTLAKVRGGALKGESIYEADYREVASLKALADEAGVAIIVITHTRKAEADDPFDTVSGTLGITGAADTTLILSRDGMGVTLRVTGRDVAEKEAAVEFDRAAFRWRELGDAATARRTDERDVILAALKTADGPITPGEIAEKIGRKIGNVRQLLSRMVKAGEVNKIGRGRYHHPGADPDDIDDKMTKEMMEDQADPLECDIHSYADPDDIDDKMINVGVGEPVEAAECHLIIDVITPHTHPIDDKPMEEPSTLSLVWG